MQTGSDIIIMDEVDHVDLKKFYADLKHKLYGHLKVTVPDVKTILTFLWCLKHASLPELPVEMIVKIAKYCKIQVYVCAGCGCRIELHKERNISFQGAVCSVECANLSGIFLVEQGIVYTNAFSGML